MESRRWTNPSHPAPLFAATVLLYLGSAYAVLLAIVGRSFLELFAALCLFSAGFLIANARTIGWVLAVTTTAIEIATPFAALAVNFTDNLNSGLLVGVLLPLATFAVLLHPASHDYQRVWFA